MREEASTYNKVQDVQGRARQKRFAAVFVLFAAAVLVSIVVSAGTGDVSIPPARIAELIFSGGDGSLEEMILMQIRLPRVLMAALLGGALSVSGFLLQTFFANPMAGPFVLGISSGARMAVAITLVVLAGRTLQVTSAALVAAAFIGTVACTGVIVLFSHRIRQMAALLVTGIMVGYICSAVTDFVISFADDSDIVNLRGWTQGSFSGTDWKNVAISVLLVMAAMAAAILLSKPMSAYLMGESYASSVGVNIRRFRLALILVSSLLSACVTAFAGPISFVGVAVPHLVRKALGSSAPLPVIPACFLGGAFFCVVCDLVARTVFSPAELGVSTVTAIFGAPVVIAVMLQKKRG